ncbi:MAG TPA: hypothetical protein VHM25_21780 [Polyangiaceae bacterium]|jgi:hypothetical protein|nr:hypothetical protein [Polyangiaceae bacterium]
MGLGSACGASVDEPMAPKEIVFITPSSSGGTAGSEPTAGGPSAGSSTGGTAGMAGMAGMAGSDAGAGGGHECDGNYDCPAVAYFSHAIIEVDLPISVADAADAIFTACRNDECYSEKGSAQVEVIGSSFLETEVETHGWQRAQDFGFVSLKFDESGATPFAVLHWRFHLDSEPIASDHYSLTVQPVAASTPTTLFDDQLNYTTVAADPSLVAEGFCSHCSEVSYGTVDARANH